MNWKSIWQTPYLLEAESAQNILSGYGIASQLINQKDSAYVLLGEIKIMVPEGMVEEARKYLSTSGYIQDAAYLN